MIEEVGRTPSEISLRVGGFMRWRTLLRWFGPAALAVLLAAGVSYRHRLDPALSRVPGLDDTACHLAIINRVASGEAMYAAIGTELRSRGYPSGSIANWRTPLHYWAVARLGIQPTSRLLTAGALLAIGLGAYALRRRFHGAWLAAGVLLLGTLIPVLTFRPAAIAMAEYWAGLLLVLSLACYHLQRWTIAAGFGVLAIFVRELAIPFGLICGLLALRERRSTESTVWVVGGVAYVAYYLIHARAVSDAMLATDWMWQHSWLRFLGWVFVLQTAWASGWTIFLPKVATPIVVALALVGTFAPSMPSQLRWPLLIYAALFCAVGQEFNFYWGFVTAPLWTFALLYCAEGARSVLSRSDS